MGTTRMKLTIAFLSLAIFVTGCNFCSLGTSSNQYKVHYTKTPIKIDGKLDEAAWKKAKPLDFRALPKSSCTEKGMVKMLWDDKYVYVSGVLHDTDIVQEATENWLHHYQTGDLMEVFLKPGGKRHYWEIYSTPNNLKTSFFFLSGGRARLSGCFDYKISGLQVASISEGTFNNEKDIDTLWTTEIAIPRKELEKDGGKIAPGEVWTFLIGRYNYSIHLDKKELTTSGYPASGSFHDFRSWNHLKFVK
jgi:Carbohydrate family 9 binding domain-like